MMERAQDFDTSRLFASITARHPDLAGAKLAPCSEGWDCAAFDLAGRVIIKRPKRPAAETGLRQEAAVLALVRPRVTLPVPDLQLVDDPLLSWHEKLSGQRLEAAGYEVLTPPQREELAACLARFQAEVHLVSVPFAGPVQPWAAPDALQAMAPPLVPERWRAAARNVLADQAALPPDPLGEVFGQFDGHGWNMAFDHEVGRLNGIYDFGDAGIGARHRDFIYCGLTSLDLMARVVMAYGALTGLAVDLNRVRVLAGAHRLWELAEGSEADRPGLVARFGQWVEWMAAV